MAIMIIAGVFLHLSSVSVSSFIVYSQRSFLCLFGHSNRLLTVLAETGKNTEKTASHEGDLKSESVALKALLKAELCATCDFSPGHDTANAAGFYQWATGSVTTVLPHSAIDSDLTDIYLNGNLPDYNFKIKERLGSLLTSSTFNQYMFVHTIIKHFYRNIRAELLAYVRLHLTLCMSFD